MKIDRTNEFNLGRFLEKYNLNRDLKIKRRDERSLQITELDPADIKLESFHVGPSNFGCDNKDWQIGLKNSGRIPLDIVALEALLENPDQIPECIRNMEGKGHTIVMTFDGTVLAHEDDRGPDGDERYSDVDEYILCLHNDVLGLNVGLLRSYVGRACLGSDFSVVI